MQFWDTHAALPFGFAHTAPHAPQLLIPVAMFASHPVAALLSQSAQPSWQEIEHTPDEHAGVPL